MVLIDRVKARWLSILVHAGALLPLASLVWDWRRGGFLADPVQEIENRTGQTALILLLLALACTPLDALFGFKRVLRLRRALGLYAALYAGLHFLTFVGLDYGFRFDLLGEALLDQRFVLAGLAAGLILLALAMTSTQGWQRRLGRSWKRLQRLVYAAGILVVVHFAWSVKDIRVPLRYGAVLALLLVLRLPPLRRAAGRLRRRLVRKERPQPTSGPPPLGSSAVRDPASD
jgi:sulfoxide reductase heme-binding subunit YedZ